MIKQELTYWVTFALIPKMWTKRKNEIYVRCYQHEPQISIVDLFDDSSNWDLVGLNDVEKSQFAEARAQLPNNSFLVEELIAQGYDILPITNDDYPKILKKNLQYNAPTVIYTKGNKALLQEASIAIVGSRSADTLSLTFTDNIAKKAVSENKVVVSGFAKGVDRQALDSAVRANGKSIIVLPQGIMTFGSGFKQYYKQVAQGNVLVMSTFAPKAPWSVEFAMTRNPIIYGMASKIYVAQSNDKGGTWSGVIDGLRKKRLIYVRYPNKNEKNANLQLIQKGAFAVDINGQILTQSVEDKKAPKQHQKEEIDFQIIETLKKFGMLSAKQIIQHLNIEWKDDKMRRHLNNLQQVEKTKKGNKVYYSLKGKKPQQLLLSLD